MSARGTLAVYHCQNESDNFLPSSSSSSSSSPRVISRNSRGRRAAPAAFSDHGRSLGLLVSAFTASRGTWLGSGRVDEVLLTFRRRVRQCLKTGRAFSFARGSFVHVIEDFPCFLIEFGSEFVSCGICFARICPLYIQGRH